MTTIIKRIVARYEAEFGNFARGVAEASKKHDDFTKKVVGGSKDAQRATDATGKSVLGLGEAARRTGTNFDGVVPKIDRATKSTDDLKRSVTILGQTFTGLTPAMAPAANRIEAVVAATSRMKMALGGAAALTGTVAASAFIGLADQAKGIENQLKGIGAGSDEAKRQIYALAIETRTPLEATVGLLRSMQKSLPNQELAQTLTQVGTLNRLLTIGGLDAGARGSVALQFGQALQSGVLQGDELRALRESAPFELMEAIAKAAGGTVEQLKDMGSEGKITRDVMVQALTDLEQVSRDKFGAFQMTVGESMAVFNTALVGTVGELDKTVGASAAFADIISGMGSFLTNHTQAITTLASAMQMLVQVSLVAAGSRGLVAVGAAAATTAERLRLLAGEMIMTHTASSTAAAAMGTLQRGLGSVIAMLGGPWGAAIFAGVGAMWLMSEATTSVTENLDNAGTALEDFQTNMRKMEEATSALETDRARLKAINEELTKSINDQADAADAVAGREADAINARIAKNQELLAVYRAIAGEDLERSSRQLEEARRELESEARLMSRGVVGGAMALWSGEQVAPEYARELADRAAAGERLNARELEFLETYGRIREQIAENKEALQDFADTAPAMANAHVRAWQAQQKAAEEAAKSEILSIETLNKKTDERLAKLAELKRQRAEAQAVADRSPMGPERDAALRAIDNADQQIRELRNVEERVASLRDRLDEVNKGVSQNRVFDPNDVMKNRIEALERELRDAVAAGEDLDEVKLTALEAAIAAAEARARELKMTLREAAATDFDSLSERMRTGPLPYAQDVATAGAVNTDMIDFIKRKESMSPTPYNDEGTLRAGYGSDLIYKQQPDGVWVPTKVFAGMTVSQREADYSLQMRLTKEFLPPIIQAIGQDKWNSYNSNQQAALASLSWNYGAGAWTNPNTLGRVAEAARSGSSQDVAAAIATLAMQKTRSEQDSGVKTKDGLPMNYHRRMEEAGLFGDTSATAEQAAAITKEYQDQANLDAQRKKRQDDYLASLKDENELLALKASLNGKSSVEQDYQIRVHKALSEATAAGIDLESRYLDTQLTMRDAIIRKVQDEMQAEAELNATREVERLKQIEHEKELQKERDRVAERAAHHKQVEQDIQGIIVGSVMRTGDWREMAGRLIEQLAQAYLYAGLFNSGPLARKDGGSGLMGWLSGGLTNWLTGGATMSAMGNIMTDMGPVQLNRYAYGGIARSPQLSIFGEGRQPEAYVPLPDGRTIPVTIKTPEVPSLAGVSTLQTMKLQLDLNNEMLEARIVDGSTPVAVEVTRQGIGQFSQNELPGRVRQSNQDPKRVRS